MTSCASETCRMCIAHAGSDRIVHDLRSPLVVALGYLDELQLFKSRLLDNLVSADIESESAISQEQIAREIEEEMSLCIDMIRDSLDELDASILSLKDRG